MYQLSNTPSTLRGSCHFHLANHETKPSKVNAQIHPLVSGRAKIQTHIFWIHVSVAHLEQYDAILNAI